MTTSKISRAVLILTALPALMIGAQALIDPQAVMDNVGQVLPNASSYNSARAVYGGMHLAFGLFFFYGAFRARREALRLLGLYTTGFIVGRLLSLVVDGSPNAFISSWMIIEGAMAVAAWWLYYRESRKISVAVEEKRYVMESA